MVDASQVCIKRSKRFFGGTSSQLFPVTDVLNFMESCFGESFLPAWWELPNPPRPPRWTPARGACSFLVMRFNPGQAAHRSRRTPPVEGPVEPLIDSHKRLSVPQLGSNVMVFLSDLLCHPSVLRNGRPHPLHVQEIFTVLFLLRNVLIVMAPLLPSASGRLVG